MTAPTIGQIVYYTPGANEPILTQDAGGLPAMVVNANEEGDRLNLVVFDSEGNVHARRNVTMLDSAPPAKKAKRGKDVKDVKDVKEGEEGEEAEPKNGEAVEPWPPVMGPYAMAARKEIVVPEVKPPTLASLTPDKTVCGSPEFELECAGTGFTALSVIHMGTVPVITRYYSPEMVTTMVQPESAAPGETEVKIVNGELESEKLTVTFEPAPVVEPAPPIVVDSEPKPPDPEPPPPLSRRQEMGGSGGLAADAEIVRPKTKR
jgi:hypothetical protein